MLEVDPNLRFTVPEGVLARTVGDDIVLLRIGDGEMFTLSGVAAAAWRAFSDGGTVGQAVEGLAAEYEAQAERIAGDVDALVRDLVGRELLTPTPGRM